MAAVGADRTRKQKITIQAAEVDGTLTNFPFYLDRTHLDDEVISPTDSNRSQADGGDLQASSDEDGSTRIALEVVEWDTDSVHATADGVIEVHILVPSVSASVATDIWIWYQTPTSSTQPAVTAAYGRNAVWAAYECVYHFNGDPNGGTTGDIDSSGNITGATLTHTSVDLVAGRFGTGAWNFASTEAMDTNFNPGAAGANHTSQVMVDTTANASGTDYVMDNSNGSTGVKFLSASGDLDYKGDASDGSWSLNSTLDTGNPANGWCNLIGTNNSSAGVVLYQNGVSDLTDTGITGTLVSSASNVVLAEEYDFSSGSACAIDEYRFTETTLSAANVAAFESNTATPGTFAVAGTPEAVGGGGGATPHNPFGIALYGPFAGPIS